MNQAFPPSPASNIDQHLCMVGGGERIAENDHPGDDRAFLVLSQIPLETHRTNGGLWEKKGLIFFSTLLRSRSYSLAEAGLDFAVLLPACWVLCPMLSYLPLESESQSRLFYLALISTKCRLTAAVPSPASTSVPTTWSSTVQQKNSAGKGCNLPSRWSKAKRNERNEF